MYLADFLCLFAFLILVSGWIYFIIEIFRGNVKWGDVPNIEHNTTFDYNHNYNYYYYYRNNLSTDRLPSADLHSGCSVHDEYNILHGRSPGSF